MITKENILQTLRVLKPELQRRYKVREIGLFGSFIREEQSQTSDIDILVEFEAPIGLFKFLELEEYLEARLGWKVDLVSKKALKPRIGRYILQEVLMI